MGRCVCSSSAPARRSWESSPPPGGED